MSKRSRFAAALSAAVLMAAALTPVACVTRRVRELVFSEGGTEVLLRGTREGGSRVDLGYQHPRTIPARRLAEILSRIDIRRSGDAGDTPAPAIPPTKLALVAAGLAAALAAADPGQQLVLRSTRTERKFGLLRREYLTSLVAYVDNGDLIVHLRHIDWAIPKPRPDRLPEPWIHKHPMDFQVLPGPGMERIGPQAVRVSGIALLSEPASDGAPEPPPPSPEAFTETLEGLSAETLRALAVLREARERGELADREYRHLVDALLHPD